MVGFFLDVMVDALCRFRCGRAGQGEVRIWRELSEAARG